MTEFVPVPTVVLGRLLDRESAVGGKFSRSMALTHMMLDWATGIRRSRQDYADIWMWSKSKVARDLPDLYDDAEKLLSFRVPELVDESTEVVITDLFPGMPATPPARQPARLRGMLFYEKNTWQYKFAVAFALRLEAEGISTKEYEDHPARAIQGYANTFDKLNRIDKHTQETIIKVVKYLFKEDDFWIRTANLRSANQLRRKKNKEGEYVFDQLLRKMERHSRVPQYDRSTRIDEIRDTSAEAIRILHGQNRPTPERGFPPRPNG